MNGRVDLITLLPRWAVKWATDRYTKLKGFHVVLDEAGVSHVHLSCAHSVSVRRYYHGHDYEGLSQDKSKEWDIPLRHIEADIQLGHLLEEDEYSHFKADNEAEIVKCLQAYYHAEKAEKIEQIVNVLRNNNAIELFYQPSILLALICSISCLSHSIDTCSIERVGKNLYYEIFASLLRLYLVRYVSISENIIPISAETPPPSLTYPEVANHCSYELYMVGHFAFHLLNTNSIDSELTESVNFVKLKMIADYAGCLNAVKEREALPKILNTDFSVVMQNFNVLVPLSETIQNDMIKSYQFLHPCLRLLFASYFITSCISAEIKSGMPNMMIHAFIDNIWLNKNARLTSDDKKQITSFIKMFVHGYYEFDKSTYKLFMQLTKSPRLDDELVCRIELIGKKHFTTAIAKASRLKQTSSELIVEFDEPDEIDIGNEIILLYTKLVILEEHGFEILHNNNKITFKSEHQSLLDQLYECFSAALQEKPELTKRFSLFKSIQLNKQNALPEVETIRRVDCTMQ